jgi:hypothetical protein
VFIGNSQNVEHLGYALGVCPKCRKEGAFTVYTAKRNITVFVVAAVPVGEQMIVECSHCKVRFAIPKDNQQEMRQRLISADELAHQALAGAQARAAAANGSQLQSGPTLYQLLQLDPSADPDVIDAAYKRLAFKYHPDRDKSPEASQRMQVINEAKRILSDPNMRERYDRSIGIVRKPPPPARSAGIRADDV